MTEDAPPADMNGTDENPDAPRLGDAANVHTTASAPKQPAGYPVEEVLRPITLPQNMSEASFDPHAEVSPYRGAAALRARYGVTDKIQLGLTYMLGGVYEDPAAMNGTSFHSGKAFGLDVTVMLQKWIGVRVGLPFYVQPFAMSLALGAPIKFTFGDKFAIGGLDDLLNIKLAKFAPSFDQEYYNAVGVANDMNGTEQDRGHIRVSIYGEMQYRPNVALIGRIGVDDNLGPPGGNAPGTTNGGGGQQTFLRAGIQWTPRHFVDLGGSIGFDDLAHGGSFAPGVYAALRI